MEVICTLLWSSNTISGPGVNINIWKISITFHRYLFICNMMVFGLGMGLCKQECCLHAYTLVCFGHILCSGKSCMFPWFHIYLYISYPPYFGQDMGLDMQEYRVHVLSWDSIDTFISAIWWHLAEALACVSKNIACMHINLCAQVTLCTQTGRACSPDSISTFISLI